MVQGIFRIFVVWLREHFCAGEAGVSDVQGRCFQELKSLLRDRRYIASVPSSRQRVRKRAVFFRPFRKKILPLQVESFLERIELI